MAQNWIRPLLNVLKNQIEMCRFWNVLFLELAVVESGMNTTRNVAFGKTEWALLDCALLVIQSFGDTLFLPLECAHLGIYSFLECALFEMCSFWNLLFWKVFFWAQYWIWPKWTVFFLDCARCYSIRLNLLKWALSSFAFQSF